jgi:hypothetical protein
MKKILCIFFCLLPILGGKAQTLYKDQVRIEKESITRSEDNNVLTINLDIVLQHIHICEDQVVDALQHVFDFAFFVCYFQRIVNVSVSEWFGGNYLFCELELIQDV